MGRLKQLLGDLGKKPPNFKVEPEEISLLSLRQIIINQNELLISSGNYNLRRENRELIARIEYFIEHKE